MNEFDREEWKLRINALLWSCLPCDTTLQQAEDCAIKMLDIVDSVYRAREEEA